MKRFAVAALGYVAAAFAASLFIHAAFFAPLGLTLDDVTGVIAGTLLVSVPFFALIVAATALVPSVLALLVLDRLALRDWFSTLMAGAAISLAVVGMIWAAMPDARLGDRMLQSDVVGLALGAGLVGGFAYWLVANLLGAAISPAR